MDKVRTVERVRGFGDSTIFIVVATCSGFGCTGRTIGLKIRRFLAGPMGGGMVLRAYTGVVAGMSRVQRGEDSSLLVERGLRAIMPVVRDKCVGGVLLRSSFIACRSGCARLLSVHRGCNCVVIVRFKSSVRGKILDGTMNTDMGTGGFCSAFHRVTRKFFRYLMNPVVKGEVMLLIPCRGTGRSCRSEITVIAETEGVMRGFRGQVSDVFHYKVKEIGRLKDIGRSFGRTIITLERDVDRMIRVRSMPTTRGCSKRCPESLRVECRGEVLRGSTTKTVGYTRKFFR